MLYDESCPECASEDFEIEDYSDSFGPYGGEQWWFCRCTKGGCKFSIDKIYDLSNVIIEKEGD